VFSAPASGTASLSVDSTPEARHHFGLWVLDDPDAPLDLLTQADFDRDDERMPYFGMIWASAESLVARLLMGPRLDGARVLDLGCGLGACGFAALCLGAHVTFFDWEPRALDIVAASARQQGTSAATYELVVGDWRQPPRFDPFDLILAADVLYERRNVPAVAAFIASNLRSDAEAWVADPGRIQAGLFPEMAQQAGLAVETEVLPPQPHGMQIKLLRTRL